MKAVLAYGFLLSGSFFWMLMVTPEDLPLPERTIFCCLIGFISGTLAEAQKRRKIRTVINTGALISIVSICLSLAFEAIPIEEKPVGLSYAVVALCGFLGLPGSKTIEALASLTRKFLPRVLSELFDDEKDEK